MYIYIYIFKEIESVYFGMKWTEAFGNVSKIKRKTFRRNWKKRGKKFIPKYC